MVLSWSFLVRYGERWVRSVRMEEAVAKVR